MKTKKEIVPEIRIISHDDTFLRKLEDKPKVSYLLSIPISKSPVSLTIPSVRRIEGKELNIKEREAAFKIIGENAARLAREILSWGVVYKLEMDEDSITVITLGENICCWDQLDKNVIKEIRKTYKEMKFKKVSVAPIEHIRGECSY